MPTQEQPKRTMSCWQEGYDAGYAGISNSENPYENNTREFDDWLDGWVDGRTALTREQKDLPKSTHSDYYN